MLYPDPELERDTFSSLGSSFPTTPAGGSSAPGDASVLTLILTLIGLTDGGGGGLSALITLILRTGVQYRLLATVVYILFANGIITGNILVPLFTWEAIELFLLKTYVPKLSILSVVFTLVGVAQHHVPTLTKFIETMHKIGKDTALFMYCFLVTHFVYCKVWLGQDLRTIFYSVLEKPTEYVAT